MVCDNGRFTWVKPLITHVTPGPGGRSAAVSGRLTGLVPGHSYAVYGGRMAAPVPVGTASAGGTVSLSAVYLPQEKTDASTQDIVKYLLPGDAFSVEVSDLTDPSAPTVAVDAGRLAADRVCGHLESAVAYHQRVLSDGAPGGNSVGPGCTLVQQADGNLVYYSLATGEAVWSARTAGHPGARTVMQTDGNLVVYSTTGAVLFQTRTAGHRGVNLSVQDDGNLVIYDAAGHALWQAGSSTRR